MLDGNDDSEKPGLEELYTSATHSSNLRVQAERRGDADFIIAAGWSQSRIGGALMRLHTEYDGAERLRLAAASDFMGAKADKDARKAAARQAHEFNLHEAGLLLQKLKSWPDVRSQVTLHLVKLKVENAEAKAVEVLRWWLSQTCPVCNGTKMQVAQGTNRHNGKICRACSGTGIRALPGYTDDRALHWQHEAKRLANWLDTCTAKYRAWMGRPLRNGEPAASARTTMIVARCQALLKANPSDGAARATLDRLTKGQVV